MNTSQSKITIYEAARVSIFSGNVKMRSASNVLKKGKNRIYQEFRIFANRKQRYEIEKIVSIYTSKDKCTRGHLTTSINSVKNAPRFGELLKTHRHAWHLLWKKFDIQIEGNAFTQMALRFHMFHLLQTASVHNTTIDAGLPARGLHGEAYRGHIFWDELFVMPFFRSPCPRDIEGLASI